MMSGAIEDWQISASSALSPAKEPQCQMRYARLYMASGRAWCAAHKAAFEWIQIDLGVASKVILISCFIIMLIVKKTNLGVLHRKGYWYHDPGKGRW